MALHVVPVPVGMTAEEAFEEIVTLGMLAADSRQRPVGEWATVDCGCPPGECSHDVGAVRAPVFRERHDGVLIGVEVFGFRVPSFLWWLFAGRERP